MKTLAVSQGHYGLYLRLSWEGARQVALNPGAQRPSKLSLGEESADILTGVALLSHTK